MCTSANKQTRKTVTKTAFVYLMISIICAAFGAIYELFSHEVYSYFMLYAFLFPLIGGTLPFFVLACSRVRLPDAIACKLYHAGIAALTVGSLFTGVLEIYGTTNRLTAVYWIVGAGLVVCGVGKYLVSLRGRAET